MFTSSVHKIDSFLKRFTLCVSVCVCVCARARVLATRDTRTSDPLELALSTVGN